jgi:hypothetical protein
MDKSSGKRKPAKGETTGKERQKESKKRYGVNPIVKTLRRFICGAAYWKI